MLGKLTRLFGNHPPDDTTKENEAGNIKKRQVENCGDASSSKKIRAEDADKVKEVLVNPDNQEKINQNDKIVEEIFVVEKSEYETAIDKPKPVEDQAANADYHTEMSNMNEQLYTASIELQFLQSSLSSPILCCICKTLPRSLPISSCIKHHKFCNSCSSKIPDCPICSKPLCKESSPLLTTLLSSLTRQCTWSTMGCSYQSRLEQLEKHEQSCRYQAVFCWGCQTNSPLHTFDKHDPDLACFSFSSVHMSPVIKTMLNSIPHFNAQFPLQYTGDIEWNPLAVKYAGKMFYLRIKRIAGRGVWVFYIAAQLLPRHCLRYMATITLYCPNKNITMGTNWSYTGQPTSLVIGLDRVLRKGNCLLMTDPAMEQVMTIAPDKRGTLFTVRVEIDDAEDK